MPLRALCCVLNLIQRFICAIPVYLVMALIATDFKTFVVDWAFGQPHDYMFLVYPLVRFVFFRRSFCNSGRFCRCFCSRQL